MPQMPVDMNAGDGAGDVRQIRLGIPVDTSFPSSC